MDSTAHALKFIHCVEPMCKIIRYSTCGFHTLNFILGMEPTWRKLVYMWIPCTEFHPKRGTNVQTRFLNVNSKYGISFRKLDPFSGQSLYSFKINLSFFIFIILNPPISNIPSYMKPVKKIQFFHYIQNN